MKTVTVKSEEEYAAEYATGGRAELTRVKDWSDAFAEQIDQLLAPHGFELVTYDGPGYDGTDMIAWSIEPRKQHQ